MMESGLEPRGYCQGKARASGWVLGLEKRREVGGSLACSHSVRDSSTLVGCTVRSPQG